MLPPGSAPDALLIHQKADDHLPNDAACTIDDELKKINFELHVSQLQCRQWKKRAHIIMDKSCFLPGCCGPRCCVCCRVFITLVCVALSVLLFVESGQESYEPVDVSHETTHSSFLPPRNTYTSEMDCGGQHSGYIHAHDALYFYFDNAVTQDVSFSTCYSTIDTTLVLMDSRAYHIHSSSTNACDGDNCRDNSVFSWCNAFTETFTMADLAAGSYTLRLRPFNSGDYDIRIVCDSAGSSSSDDGGKQMPSGKIFAGLFLLSLGMVIAAWNWIKKKCCCSVEQSIDEQAREMALDIEVKDGLITSVIPNDAAQHDVSELKTSKHKLLVSQCEHKLWQKIVDLALGQVFCVVRGCGDCDFCRAFVALACFWWSIALFVQGDDGLFLLSLGIVIAAWEWIKKKFSRRIKNKFIAEKSLDEQALEMAHDIEFKEGLIPYVAVHRDVELIEEDKQQRQKGESDVEEMKMSISAR